jgi:hypothetical protein
LRLKMALNPRSDVLIAELSVVGSEFGRPGAHRVSSR